eukprot:6187843-Amphidinium_carterae.2
MTCRFGASNGRQCLLLQMIFMVGLLLQTFTPSGKMSAVLTATSWCKSQCGVVQMHKQQKPEFMNAMLVRLDAPICTK